MTRLPPIFEWLRPWAVRGRMSEATSVTRFLGSVTPLAQSDPTVLDKIDGDAVVDVLAKDYSVPPHILRGGGEVAQIRAVRAASAAAAALQEEAAP